MKTKKGVPDFFLNCFSALCFRLFLYLLQLNCTFFKTMLKPQNLHHIIYIRVYFRVYVPLVYLLFLFNFLSLLALTTLAQCMHIRICSFIHVHFFVQFCVSLLVCSFLFVSFRFKPCATRFHSFLIICSLFLQMILQTVCYSFPLLSNHL